MSEENKPKEKFFIVWDWMIKMGLKGLERDIYAIIYSYSRDNNGVYYGSLDTLGEMTGYNPDVCCRILKKLTAEGLLKKEVIIKNKTKHCAYQALYKKYYTLTKSQEVVDKKSRGVLTKSQEVVDKKSDNSTGYNIEYSTDNIRHNENFSKNSSSGQPKDSLQAEACLTRGETEIEAVEAFLAERESNILEDLNNHILDKAVREQAEADKLLECELADSSPKEIPPSAAAPLLKALREEKLNESIAEYEKGIRRATGKKNNIPRDATTRKAIKKIIEQLDGMSLEKAGYMCASHYWSMGESMHKDGKDGKGCFISALRLSVHASNFDLIKNTQNIRTSPMSACNDDLYQGEER